MSLTTTVLNFVTAAFSEASLTLYDTVYSPGTVFTIPELFTLILGNALSKESDALIPDVKNEFKVLRSSPACKSTLSAPVKVITGFKVSITCTVRNTDAATFPAASDT